MKLSFLELDPAERRLYIEQAAARRGVLPVLLEKDFWVSWLLAAIFESEFAEHVVFKGGTSLRNQAAKWMAKAEAACGAAVERTIMPAIERRVSEILGPRLGGWLQYLVDSATRSPVLLSHYPCAEPSGFEHLKRSVKLEFGSLTDQRPVGRHPIRPWIADVLGSAFDDWACEVVSLEVERTFWEKATILHAEFHRPAEKATPDRFSRHYADLAALAKHPAAEAALGRPELRDGVVEWKARFFGSSWARYDLAKPGTFRLAPKAERVAELRRDYQAMRVMYLSEPPPFDEVVEKLEGLEGRVNRDERP